MNCGWGIERCEEGKLMLGRTKRRTHGLSAPRLYTATAMEGSAKTIGGDLQVSPNSTSASSLCRCGFGSCDAHNSNSSKSGRP